MLRLAPRSWLSWDFDVLDGDDEVAEVALSAWRERGEVTARGAPYRVWRDGLTGPFLLQSGDEVLARAVKESAFRQRFAVAHAGRDYLLRKAGLFAATFVLTDGGDEIGRVTRDGILTHRATADLPATLPLPVRVFLIWLAVIMWKRDSEAASSAAVSASVAASG